MWDMERHDREHRRIERGRGVQVSVHKVAAVSYTYETEKMTFSMMPIRQVTMARPNSDRPKNTWRGR